MLKKLAAQKFRVLFHRTLRDQDVTSYDKDKVYTGRELFTARTAIYPLGRADQKAWFGGTCANTARWFLPDSPEVAVGQKRTCCTNHGRMVVQRTE